MTREIQKVRFTTTESEKLLRDWNLSQHGAGEPIPSSVRTAYIGASLPQLKSMALDGNSSASYLLFEYFRFQKHDNTYFYWRNKAAANGFEPAIIASRSDALSGEWDSQQFTFPAVLGLLFLIVVVVGSASFFYRRYKKGKSRDS